MGRPAKRVEETVAAVRTLGGKTTALGLAKHLGMELNAARTCLVRAAAKGFLVRDWPGAYRMAEVVATGAVALGAK